MSEKNTPSPIESHTEYAYTHSRCRRCGEVVPLEAGRETSACVRCGEPVIS